MVYSLWNWDTLRYDYYRDDSGPRPGQPVLARNKYKNGDSVRPEDVLPILPEDALQIGSGDAAQGRVAVRRREATLGQDPPVRAGLMAPTTWIVAAAGYLAYRMFTR